MTGCPGCGRESIIVVAGYDMAVAHETDDAEYCVVTDGVEGREVHVHTTGGRWLSREESDG